MGETEYSCKKYVVGEAIKEFGELEAVMEKYGIENLDDFIKEYSSKNIKLANDNYAFEQELAELKQKAIVPKFKIGQEVYAIFDRTLWGERMIEVVNAKIIGIITTNKIQYMFSNLADWYIEENVFATKEEALAKLEELGEKK